MPIFKLSGLVSIIGCGLLAVAIIDFMNKGTLWILVGSLSFSMIATFPFCILLNWETKSSKNKIRGIEIKNALSLKLN